MERANSLSFLDSVPTQIPRLLGHQDYWSMSVAHWPKVSGSGEITTMAMRHNVERSSRMLAVSSSGRILWTLGNRAACIVAYDDAEQFRQL